MSTDASVAFRTWLSSYVRPALGERGYSRTGSTFHRRAPEGWGVVNFQKSQFGDSRRARFTVNLGVALDRLSAARGDDPDRKPQEHRCVWRCRIGALLGDAADRWWTIDEGTDLEALTAEVILPVVDVGLPLVDERLTADGFMAASARRPRVGQVVGFTDDEISGFLGEQR